MKRIKVLQFSLAASAGGRTQYLLNLWKSIDRTKFSFDFITFSDVLSFENDLLKTGANVFHIKNYPEKNENAFRREFESVLKENNYDIIHIATSFWKNTIIEKIAKECGVKRIIIHSHSSGIEGKNINGRSAINLHERIKKSIDANLATDFVACSKSAANWLYGDSIPKDKIKIIYNGVDSERFRYDPWQRQNIRKKLGLEDCFVLGFVGRLEMVKNVPFLIDLLEKLVHKDRNISLLIVGDGTQLAALQDTVVKRHLDSHVQFLGSVKDVEKFYNAFDIFLMPSFFEGFPLSLLEAQCSGLKCMVSDCISDEAVVTELVRRLPLDDAGLWIQTIISIASGYERKDCSAVIANAGFDSSSVAKNIETLYLEAGNNVF